MKFRIISAGDTRAVGRLLTPAHHDDPAFDRGVQAIVDGVRTGGDGALTRFAQEFDGLSAPLEVSRQEMRKAAVLARIAAHDIHAVATADILHAATVGGANALKRDDLGRLAPGMKADLVVVDLKCPHMMPARDPLRSLVYHAAERAVRDVYIDGAQVVGEGRVLTLDQADAAERLTAAQQRMMAAVPQRDYKGRTAEQISPLCLPLV